MTKVNIAFTVKVDPREYANRVMCDPTAGPRDVARHLKASIETKTARYLEHRGVAEEESSSATNRA